MYAVLYPTMMSENAWIDAWMLGKLMFYRYVVASGLLAYVYS